MPWNDIRNSIKEVVKHVQGHIAYYMTRPNLLNSEAIFLDVSKIEPNSDTIFIMGSGSSISDMSQKEWEHIDERGDVMSFNWFPRGEFIPVDYHVMREAGGHGWTHITRKKKIQEYLRTINNNSYFDDTILFIFDDKFSLDSVTALYMSDKIKRRRIITCGSDLSIYSEITRKLVRTNSDDEFVVDEPSRHIKKLSYGGGTLFETVNIAYLLGYKNIILVGVDLYDRRYFFTDDNELREGEKERSATISDNHNTADPVISGMKKWNEFFNQNKISLEVYNPYSLLCTHNALQKYEGVQKSIEDPRSNKT